MIGGIGNIAEHCLSFWIIFQCLCNKVPSFLTAGLYLVTSTGERLEGKGGDGVSWKAIRKRVKKWGSTPQTQGPNRAEVALQNRQRREEPQVIGGKDILPVSPGQKGFHFLTSPNCINHLL
jgi:hypothetical protein